MGATHVLLTTAGRGTSRVPRPVPKNQGPLPAFDLSGDPFTTLPGNLRALPSGWDKQFWRGNAWSVTIPGLPWVPGASSVHPERALSWFLDRWTPEWQTKILTGHAERGYTHFSLSWPDSRAYGQSLDQFIATCRLVQSWGFYVHVFLGSKDFDPWNETWVGWWGQTLAPVLQALLDAGCVDIITPGWEWNIWNVPGDVTFDIYHNLAAMATPRGVDVWTHFAIEYTSWFADGGNRFDWWRSMRGILTGILYQGNPYVNSDGSLVWSMGERQARAADTQNQDTFADGTFKFVYWEADGAQQFDNDHPTEAEAAMHGYLMLCSPGGCPISGFGNGCWLPDGTPTLQG
jgi:hypothetical protein